MSRPWQDRAGVFAAALWWGSLSALGAIFVPTLFSALPSVPLAGQTAARLFAAQTWVSLGCGGLLLLVFRRNLPESGMGYAGAAIAFIAGGMLLALLGQYAVAPRILARENLALWHALGTAFAVAQWACAGAVLWKLTGSDPGS